MAINEELTWVQVQALLESSARVAIREGNAMQALYDKLNDAQDGDTVTTWAVRLFGLVDTGPQTLTINAAAFTISCLPGAGLFANFQVGQFAKITFFSGNPLNNQTVLAESKTVDSLYIPKAVNLTNETDPNANVRQQSTAAQDAKVAKAIATAAALQRISAAIVAEIALLNDFA